jgi:hypothetical protein
LISLLVHDVIASLGLDKAAGLDTSFGLLDHRRLIDQRLLATLKGAGR